MIPRPRSIRVRLALWYAGALALILGTFSAGVYLVARTKLLSEVEQRAQRELEVAVELLEEDPDQAEEIEEHGLAPVFMVYEGSTPVFASREWTDRGLPSAASLDGGSGNSRFEPHEGPPFSIVRGRVLSEGRELTVAVAVSEEEARRSLATLAMILLVGLPLALAVSLIGGYFLARRLLSPISVMAEATDRVTADRLSNRLPVKNPQDELGRLALAFNRTIARLESAFERLQRFTADASHELRTPLTAIRTVGELALGNGQSSEQFRDAIASMLEETQRLAHLVDDLLLLTRDDPEAYRARRTRLNLGELARETSDLLRVLAEERDQKIRIEIEEAPFVLADRTTLRQAIFNLLDNAIKYAPRGGEILVASRRNASGAAVIDVTDSGPGIPPEHQEKAFERFYRIDPNRSRSTGGAGLGLAIARWAVEMNQGRIELQSAVGRGSTFTIILPIDGERTDVDRS